MQHLVKRTSLNLLARAVRFWSKISVIGGTLDVFNLHKSPWTSSPNNSLKASPEVVVGWGLFFGRSPIKISVLK